MNKMNIDKLEDTFNPILEVFKTERQAGEAIGDYCQRIGVERLQQVAGVAL